MNMNRIREYFVKEVGVPEEEGNDKLDVIQIT
jgi:hypothetical protein